MKRATVYANEGTLLSNGRNSKLQLFSQNVVEKLKPGSKEQWYFLGKGLANLVNKCRKSHLIVHSKLKLFLSENTKNQIINGLRGETPLLLLME